VKDEADNPGLFFDLNDFSLTARCSPRTILRAVADGQVRGKKIRSKWIFSRKAVMGYCYGFGPRLSASERKELQELLG